jgi:HAD superfamily hydrolase (TIGR01509 family)
MSDRVLLLDVMDTLVRDPFFTRVPGFFGLTLEQLWAVKDKEVWFAFERGELDEAEYHRRAFHDERTYDVDAFLALLREGYAWIDGAQELLGELRDRGARMHALSNYPRWFTMVDEALALSRYVEWSFVSCRTGVRKPDAEAYLGAARALDVAPDACLFVDDREKNCAGAREVGMRAHRFTDVKTLRAVLADEGFL